MEHKNRKTPGRRIEITHLTVHVQAQAGIFNADLYLPTSHGKAPLVIVAHGFMRSKAKMAEWGRPLQSPCRRCLPGQTMPATGELSVS
jgi:cephalosporin-C deacetylase-like acetyl esterase